MNIFVAGGAGYIGSAAAAALIEAGNRVTVYDSLVKGYRQAVPADARFVQADLADTETLHSTLESERFDAVMHFAAFIEAGESMKDPGRFFKNNFSNSINLVDAVVKAGIPRLVFSSTAGVFASSDEPIGEGNPFGPASVYGQTKLMVEQALGWYRRVYGLRTAVLRYFNAAGAEGERGEAHQPESHLIPLVLKVALRQKPDIKIFGTDYPTPDGTNIRDYIHITDLVSAHLLALNALDGKEALLYNLGNGAGYSVREVIDTSRKVTGHPIPTVESARRPGDAPRLVASSEKIRKELGWEPKYPGLEEIIASAWKWHQEHPNGYMG